MGSTARCAPDSGRFGPPFLTLTAVTIKPAANHWPPVFFLSFSVA